MPAETTRKERRDEYHKLLRIIEYNTGGKQPALISRTSLYVVASNAGMDRGHVADRLQAARENGDVLESNGKLALATEKSLRAVVGEENQADHPRPQLIERCAAMLEEVADAE